MLPRASAVDHAGFTVPDLNEAVDFFVGVLGFELCYRETPVDAPEDDTMLLRLGIHPRSGVRGALLRLGSSSGIEVLEYTGPDAGGEPPANTTHSAGHLALRVDDIEAAAAYLRSRSDVEVFEGPNIVDVGPSAGIRWLYFKAPWGLQLELVELPRKG
jgi:catechol 2,3-dioxygenase-like lactoylglutathione lyase family enzyme